MNVSTPLAATHTNWHLPASLALSLEDTGSKLSLLQHSFTLKFLLAALLLAGYALARTPSRSKSKIPHIPGLPFIGCLEFFTNRHQFTLEGLRKYGEMFSFSVAGHRVVVISGEDARSFFFGNRTLGFGEGYKILWGSMPTLQSINVETIEESRTKVLKRLAPFITKTYIDKILPTMLNDINRLMHTWDESSQIDPFESIYNIMFQCQARSIACSEIADDSRAVQRFQDLFWNIENGAMAHVMFPWLPLPSRIRKFRGTVEVYMTLKKIIEARKNTGRVEDDALQILLDSGDGVLEIVTHIMKMLFSGTITTGVISSWLPLLLGTSPEWKGKVMADLNGVLERYSPLKDEPTHIRLSRIPAQAWESEVQNLDLCFRETTRACLTGSFLRRVLCDGVHFGGEELKTGTFIAYPIGDVHLNPEIYPDPLKWDPSRPERGEGNDIHWSYVGAGAGVHPCTGMPLARVIVKVIISMLLLEFDYTVVNEKGEQVTELPPVDRRDLYKSKPVQPVYIRYTRKEKSSSSKGV